MGLTVDGQIVTGTWVEVTAKNRYHRGARYHGAIQLVADATGRRMVGRWVGFNRDMGVDRLLGRRSRDRVSGASAARSRLTDLPFHPIDGRLTEPRPTRSS
jgi:hypothetical protein